jgi:amino acid adenylation domain-containing protein
MAASSPIVNTRVDPGRIAEFNRTDRPFRDDVTLTQLFVDQVARHHQAPAVLCDHDPGQGKSWISYGELNERVDRLACALQDRGVGPGSIVGLMFERSFAMITGIFAVLKAGGAYLPISPDDPPDRVHYQVENSGVKLLIAHNRTAGKVPAGIASLNLDAPPDPGRGSGDGSAPRVRAKAGDLAYVIYTSGSTGKPKGVMIEHRSVVNRLAWMQHQYPIGPGDVLLQKTPYYFDVSVWELFWWALQGAAVCMLMPGGEKMPLAILETVRKHKVSVMHFVPSMLNVFLEYVEGKGEPARKSLATLRQVFCSGESLSPSHVRKFNALIGGPVGSRLSNLYGPTEATVDVTYFDCPTQGDFEKIPIGKPIDNTRIHILQDGRQIPVGEVGELCIAGVGLARGYLNNERLTAERFVELGPPVGERVYRTGDLARWLPDGNIEYLGREDHQVKIRGLRIELGEIEETLRKHAGIQDCIVVAKKYSESIILLVAYVVCEEGLKWDDLRRHLRAFLPEYMVPNHFERLEAIPLGPTGKADRKALPEPEIHKAQK